MTTKLPLHVAPIQVKEDLELLKIGDCVKVSVGKAGEGSESFWVQIISMDGDTITGEVNNQLVYSAYHGYVNGETITFSFSNIFQIYLF